MMVLLVFAAVFMFFLAWYEASHGEIGIATKGVVAGVLFVIAALVA